MDGSNGVLFIGQGTGWVGTENQHPVHREATEWVEMRPIQREPTGLDGTAETGSGILQYRGNGLLFDRLRSKRGSCSSGGVWRTAKRRKRTSYGLKGGPVDREGYGVPQNGKNGLVLERYDRNGGPVHREGCGVPVVGNENLWGRAPFRSGRERRAHEEQIEVEHARDFTQLRSSPER